MDFVVLPPDGGWGWFVVVVAFFWTTLIDGTVYAFGLFLNEMVDDYQTTPSHLSIASSVQQGLYYMMGPLVAALINRFGFRAVSMSGSLIAFGGVLGSSYCTTVFGFIATFGIVLGCAFSMIYLSNILVVGFYFSRYRAIATSITVSGSAVGMTVFPIICTYCLEGFSWREKFRYLSGAHLLMMIFGLVYKPLKPTAVPTLSGAATPGTGSAIFTKDLPITADLLAPEDSVVPSNRDSLSVETSFHSGYSRTAANEILPEMNESKRCCCCTCKYRFIPCPLLWHHNRPMYRDDILYHGSNKSLPQFKSNLVDKEKANLDYNLSVIRLADMSEVLQNANCLECCPKSMTRVLLSMFDFRLFSSAAFVLLTFSGFFTFLGSGLPFLFAIDLSVKSGTPNQQASYVLSTIGISNMVGRLIFGLLCLWPRVKPMMVSEITLIFAGTGVIAYVFFEEFYAHLICSAIFGFNIATVSSLRTVVAADLVGLENLTNAFGILILMQGIAMLIGLPIGTYMYQITSTYMYTFLFSGGTIVVSGVLLCLVIPVHRAEKRRKLRKILRSAALNPPAK